MANPACSSRTVGRPAGTVKAAVRARLVEVARRLFAERGYAAVSLRAIAAAAEVNPAMAHYYFASKRGLYEAVIAETLSPVVERLNVMLAARGSAGFTLRDLLELYVRTLTASPWLPPLILREVLTEDGPMRSWFIRQFAARGGGLLTRLIRHEQAAGRLRPDLDPRLTALSLVSLAAFPFAALPVTSTVFGMRTRGRRLEQFIAHTGRLLREGTAP
ncbi:MAG: TetR/AcrR family transcriptional regulator [Gammaproteobacteria bacterium]